ncbi:MAG: symporter, partial [bacterium]
PILAFWYWCTDQYIVQRILSAKSIDDARKGSLLAALLKLSPIFILVIPGLIAAVSIPGINGDDAYPLLIISGILPSGIKGVVIVGLIAAIMSSLAAVFNVTATLFTYDLYKPKNPQASERKLVLIGRLATMATIVLAIFSVSLVKIINTQVYIFLQGVQAFISPPIVVVFICGIFFRKVSSKAALWTLIIGETIGVSRLITDVLVNSNLITSPILFAYSQINFLHFAFILFALSSTVFYVINSLESVKVELLSHSSIYPFELFSADFKLIGKNIFSLRGYRFNILLSSLILLIIIGIWGVWN